MDEIWEERHETYSKAKIELILNGFSVKEVLIDIDELKEYYIKKGIKNDAKARSKFLSGR